MSGTCRQTVESGSPISFIPPSEICSSGVRSCILCCSAFVLCCAVLCGTYGACSFSLCAAATGGQEGVTQLRPPLAEDFYSESLLDKVSEAGNVTGDLGEHSLETLAAYCFSLPSRTGCRRCMPLPGTLVSNRNLKQQSNYNCIKYSRISQVFTTATPQRAGTHSRGKSRRRQRVLPKVLSPFPHLIDAPHR